MYCQYMAVMGMYWPIHACSPMVTVLSTSCGNCVEYKLMYVILGVRFVEQCSINQIFTDNKTHKVKAIATSHGDVGCDFFINAAGQVVFRGFIHLLMLEFATSSDTISTAIQPTV